MACTSYGWIRSMQSPRFWSPRTRVAATLSIVAVLAVVAGTIRVLISSNSNWDNLVTAAPVAAATVALAALFFTATTSAGNLQRARREATIEQWIRWSSDTLPYRKEATRIFGKERLTAAQGKALAEGSELAGISSEDQQRAAECIRNTLNGLERIAVGVHMGVLDLTTLRRLGGTTIIRSYERWEPYIFHRRTTDVLDLRYKSAFTEVEDLVRRLKTHSLLQDKREIDKERLQYLSRPN